MSIEIPYEINIALPKDNNDVVYNALINTP